MKSNLNNNINLKSDLEGNKAKFEDKNINQKDFSAAKEKVEGHFQECDNHFKNKDDIHFKDQETFLDKTKEVAGDIKDKIVAGFNDAYCATKDLISGGINKDDINEAKKL